MTFENIRLRLLPNGNAALYMNVLNQTGKVDRIVSLKSDHFHRIEIHQTIEEEEKMKMIRIESIEIPNQSRITLGPGTYHIMLFEPEPVLSNDLSQPAIPMTIVLEKYGAVQIQALVQSIYDSEND